MALLILAGCTALSCVFDEGEVLRNNPFKFSSFLFVVRDYTQKNGRNIKRISNVATSERVLVSPRLLRNIIFISSYSFMKKSCDVSGT